MWYFIMKISSWQHMLSLGVKNILNKGYNVETTITFLYLMPMYILLADCIIPGQMGDNSTVLYTSCYTVQDTLYTLYTLLYRVYYVNFTQYTV